MNASERASTRAKTGKLRERMQKMVRLTMRESRIFYSGWLEKPVGNLNTKLSFIRYSPHTQQQQQYKSTQNMMANIELEMLKNVLCLAASISTKNGDQQCEKHHRITSHCPPNRKISNKEPTLTTNIDGFVRCHSHRIFDSIVYKRCMMLNHWKGI